MSSCFSGRACAAHAPLRARPLGLLVSLLLMAKSRGAAVSASGASSGSGPRAKNILLIGVDDLRPDIGGAYGQKQVKTPSLDRLAASGTTFLRACESRSVPRRL